MEHHIIWVVIWAALAIVSYTGGAVFGWVTGAASLFFPSKATAKTVIGSVVLGVSVLLLAWAFAAFAVIKAILQIIAAVHS